MSTPPLPRLLVPALWLLAAPALGATFSVVNPNDSGPGSLRGALEAAAASGAGPHVVAVQGSSSEACTLTLLSALPPVPANTTVDGTQGPCAGRFVVEGGGLAGDGLVLTGPGALRGLTVRGFGGAQLVLRGSGVEVEGCTLGPSASGEGSGVGVLLEGEGHRVGGPTEAQGNSVQGNRGAGLLVASGRDHRLLHNRVEGNGGPGIDLGGDGPTPNDPGDADSGPNDLLNTPTLLRAQTEGQQTTVEVTLSGPPSTPLHVELFRSPTVDPSGRGQGATFLGEADVTTDASGEAGLQLTLSAGLPVGEALTATATAAGVGTSEFSEVVRVEAAHPPPLDAGLPLADGGQADGGAGEDGGTEGGGQPARTGCGCQVASPFSLAGLLLLGVRRRSRSGARQGAASCVRGA